MARALLKCDVMKTIAGASFLPFLPLVLVFAASAASAACGGSVASNPSGGGPSPCVGCTDAPGGPDDPVTGHPFPQAINGSYDLRFTKVAKVTIASGPPTDGKFPSMEGHARVDILLPTGASSAYTAIVTSAFGAPTRFTVRQDGDDVVLEQDKSISFGEVSFGENVSDVPQDTYDTLTLKRTHSGSIADSFTATGAQNVYASDGDGGATATLAASGVVSKSALEPQLRVVTQSPSGPSDALLPWDPIELQASEPVSGSTSALRVNGASARAFVADKEAAFPDGSSWMGARTTLTSFDFAGKVEVDASIAGAHAVTVPFLSIPAPVAALSFDGSELGGASWGGVLHVRSTTSCETGGGCVKLGPWNADVCRVPRVGVAAKLATFGKKAVTLRYRVLTADPPAGSPTPMLETALSAQLTAPTGEHVEAVVDNAGAKALGSAGPIEGMSNATEWKTLTLAVPSSTSTESGLTLVGGDLGKRGFCHPAWHVETAVLVDSITVE